MSEGLDEGGADGDLLVVPRPHAHASAEHFNSVAEAVVVQVVIAADAAAAAAAAVDGNFKKARAEEGRMQV